MFSVRDMASGHVSPGGSSVPIGRGGRPELLLEVEGVIVDRIAPLVGICGC